MSLPFRGVPKSIRRAALLLGALGVFLGGPSAAYANLLTNGDFESGIIKKSDFIATDATTHNVWLDVNQWIVATSGSNHFAQHYDPSTNVAGNTNLLFQGFSAAGLGSGTELLLNMQYIFVNGGSTRQVRLYGFGPNGTLDNNASWPFTDGSLLSTWSLGASATWTDWSESYTLTSSYSYLVFGVLFASGSGTTQKSALRGVDNISITAVPEPAYLGLLGIALAGVGFARRRKSMQL